MTSVTNTARSTRRSERDVTENEMAWIEFLRLLSRDTDPPITLAAIQIVRKLLRRGAARRRSSM